MREGLHVIDNVLYRPPLSATKEDVINLKKLADKDLFQCPYCKAKLVVKYGDEMGLYFSHRHSEACEVKIPVRLIRQRKGKKSKLKEKQKFIMLYKPFFMTNFQIRQRITP